MSTRTSDITISDYEFEGPYPDTSRLRHAAGVYAILDHRRDLKWWVIDVGESEDVRSRVDTHDRKNCWELHRQGTLGVAVLYTPGWTADQRRELERQVRRTFNPPCGDR